jgi:repressor LexA
MQELTDKQNQLLKFIISEIRENGMPPSISEMATYLEVSSKNGVAKLLDQLEEKGYIETNG